MAQLVLLINPHPFNTECIGCTRPLEVPAGYQIFAGDLEHAICDECALKVDKQITAERDEANRRLSASE